LSLDSASLAVELGRLRKGKALRTADLLDRLGPQTRIAFEISAADPAPVVRRKVEGHIRRLLREDHERLLTAALAAFALLPQADQRLLTDREAWLAGQLGCNPRTARRRVNAAVAQLVDALIEHHHARLLPTGGRTWSETSDDIRP
jgi:hypothetical protein